MAARSRSTSKAAESPVNGSGIGDYSRSQTPELAAICEALRVLIDSVLPRAASKIWHGAPVWFIDGHPVVGYSIKARKAALLFWNGQALGEPVLRPLGKYFAAEMLFTGVSELDPPTIRRLLLAAGQDVLKDHGCSREGRETKTRQ